MNRQSINVTTAIEAAKTSPLQYTIVALCSLVLFGDGFDTQAMSYILPRLAKDWHIPGSALGPIFSSALIGLLVGYLIISSLSDRFGHKRVMILSTVFFGVCTLLTVKATSVPELIALRFLTGLGLGGAAPSAIALTGEYSAQRLRATFVLIIYCGFSLGFVAAGFAAASLLPHYGWTSLLWVGGAFPLLLAVVLALALPESVSFLVRRESRSRRLAAVMRRIDRNLPIDTDTRFVETRVDTKRAAIVSLFRDGRMAGTLLLWFVFFVNLSIFYLMQTWLPTIIGNLHYPIATVAWVTAMPTIAGTVCVVVVGPAMDRFGPYPVLTVLYIGSCGLLALAAAALSAPLWMLMVATFMAGFFVSGGQKGIIALAAIFYPAEIRSTGCGWALGVGRFGSIAGPAAAGMLFNAHWSAAEVFQAAGVVILFAGAAIYLMGRLCAPARRPLEDAASRTVA
ncbi:MFS transporter [Paraburkholderia sp. ZP32-5]|uniref:MFS transporter n=1 Tax=Paraburkholderia sp. ZP32-5 TaxID=2883245 RepID=UPI001F468A23|nr:MFS transporter [Paraburkholderia sp. ZP32-5]